MAGIGFELRRILKDDTFGAWAHAYLFGAVIVLGPFLCSVASLAAIASWSRGVASVELRNVFTGATVSVFGGSLVVTGALQVVLTRWLADLVYQGAHDDVPRCLMPALTLTVGALVLTALPFVPSLPLSAVARLLLVSLFAVVGASWTAVVFVTAAEGHRAVVAIFVVGSLVAAGAALALVPRFGLAGLIGGYGAGELVVLALLVRHLVVEFGYPRDWDWRFLDYFRRYPSLVAIGVLQNLGVWIDKFVFWASPLARSAGGFHTAPKYDSATFLGFLTCLPAMTHFFVRIEADFSQHFHDYFDEIFFRRPLGRIAAAAGALRDGVIAALVDIAKVQSVISFLCIVFAADILRWAGLPLSEVGMFRFAVTGALFYSFTLFSNVILLYLDRRREVLIVVAVHTALNFIATRATLHAGYAWYGAGFATACLVAVLVSLLFLTDQLFNLEYRTFSSIEIVGRQRGRQLRARRGGLYGRYHELDA